MTVIVAGSLQQASNLLLMPLEQLSVPISILSSCSLLQLLVVMYYYIRSIFEEVQTEAVAERRQMKELVHLQEVRYDPCRALRECFPDLFGGRSLEHAGL
jgi:hypothetical protein